ncbi:NlpC/P60 family protein [Latilactobacillus graminis]|nr:C40 family peptidase [Latilactobacillus graminis]QFP80067.1 hypothetical protein LG542_07500 [Latilactobacillus graminis]
MNHRIHQILLICLMVMGFFLVRPQVVQATPEQTQTAIKTAQDHLSELNNNISNLTLKTKQLNQQMTTKQADIKKKQTEFRQTSADYQQQVAIIEGNLRKLQTSDSSLKQNMVDSLLSSQSLSELFQKGSIMNRLLDAKADNAAETASLAKQKAAQKAELEAQQAKLVTLSQANTQAIKDLNQQKQQANGELTQLQTKFKKELAAQAAAQKAASDAGATLITSNKDLMNNKIVQEAVKYIGVPYVWGGTTPKGFDCSGLVQYVYAKNGIKLPRVSQDQSKLGKDVPLNELQPNDLLFWGRVGTAHHVAIYIGDGYFIQAPQPGDKVRMTKMTDYKPDFARRLS